MTTPINNLDPVELTAYARIAQADFDAQTQSLARFLPYNPVADIRYAYSRGVDQLVDLATFRAFDAESPIGRRPGAARVTGELLPISRKIPLAEYAQLRLRNASGDDVIAGVFADAERLARGIAARMELARGQLFQTGKVTLAENGLVTEYDSGRDATLTLPLLALEDRWTEAATADPVRDIIAWKKLVKDASGVEPNRLLVSKAVMANLQAVDKVKGAFTGSANAPGMATTATVSEVILGLATVTIETIEPPSGLTVSPVDERTVILLRDNVPLGTTAYGTTLEAQEPDYQNLGVQPGVVAGSWKTDDPINVWTKAAAIALPLLGAPDLTLSAQVVA